MGLYGNLRIDIIWIDRTASFPKVQIMRKSAKRNEVSADMDEVAKPAD